MVSKELCAEVIDELKAAANVIMEKHGLKMIATRGSYGNTMKFSMDAMVFENRTEEGGMDLLGRPLTQEAINSGLATPGCVVWVFDHKEANEWVKARVLKARDTRYLFEFVHYESDGKFTNLFKSFRLTDPDAAKVAVKPAAKPVAKKPAPTKKAA